MCGEKTISSVVGVNQYAEYDNCSSQAGKEVTSLMHHAVDAGRYVRVGWV